jgi:epoxyqueuosine reductase
MIEISERKLKNIALQQDLSIMGVHGLTPLIEALEPLKSWQKKGLCADMSYMMRDPKLMISPLELMPEARSIVTFAVKYDTRTAPPRSAGFGRVARYAWGRDYHKVLRRRLRALIESVEQDTGQKIISRFFSDSVPLLERELARQASLGFFGKNTMLIRRRSGSFFFLCEILWNVQVTDLPEKKPLAILAESGECGKCVRCIDSCPTQAFVEPYVLDANRCISFLTIEKRDSLSLVEREAIGEWIFGCDVCQEVCPFNHGTLKLSPKPDLVEFEASQGVGPLLELSYLLRMRTEREFYARFAGTALTRAKRRGLLRNAACVAANTRSELCFPALLDAANSDSDPLVRQHSYWALVRLHRDCGNTSHRAITNIMQKALADSDSRVSEEAKILCEQL